MAKLKFKKAVIIGMGLMGGSLGLALRKKKLAKQVTGLGRNMKRLNMAKVKGAADDVTTDAADAVTGADLVVIALPVMMIPAMFADIKPYISKDTIVTDMGSVKGGIAEKISGLDPGNNFIGSHPVVGSEKSGVENIVSGLYEGGMCIVTPGKNSDKKKTAKIAVLWKELGMKVKKMTPREHDACMASLSHFPHLAVFAMVTASADALSKNKNAAGQGFKDSTRIAASNESIWPDIFLMNKKEVLKNIKAYNKELENLYGMIDSGRMDGLKSYIKNARELRESIK